eukprot:TRINITY_DN2770_c0_g2_i5.p1 TRINITY_DN2770_c0_g2~~TRINITY_DN2770_c0_g2_i5.p1  ORF type:complete len:256 (-),score=59.31 TRINITY_DN2770_c0_g2_i5:164-931(-)
MVPLACCVGNWVCKFVGEWQTAWIIFIYWFKIIKAVKNKTILFCWAWFNLFSAGMMFLFSVGYLEFYSQFPCSEPGEPPKPCHPSLRNHWRAAVVGAIGCVVIQVFFFLDLLVWTCCFSVQPEASNESQPLLDKKKKKELKEVISDKGRSFKSKKYLKKGSVLPRKEGNDLGVDGNRKGPSKAGRGSKLEGVAGGDMKKKTRKFDYNDDSQTNDTNNDGDDLKPLPSSEFNPSNSVDPEVDDLMKRYSGVSYSYK